MRASVLRDEIESYILKTRDAMSFETLGHIWKLQAVLYSKARIEEDAKAVLREDEGECWVCGELMGYKELRELELPRLGSTWVCCRCSGVLYSEVIQHMEDGGQQALDREDYDE